MRISPLTSDRRGFSILVALGTTGVLLILVIGLASLYINEMKLSRLQYEGVLTYAGAEGAFEYAMLKVKNHREGFEDQLGLWAPDLAIFSGSTDRTKKMITSYDISSQSTSGSFTIQNGQSLIIPLSIGTGTSLGGGSIDPSVNTGTITVQSITSLTAGNSDALSWSIVAMSGAGIHTESIGVTGTGEINGTEVASMRLRWVDCYRYDGILNNAAFINGSCDMSILQNPTDGVQQGEMIEYFYDLTGTVNDFLTHQNAFSNMEVGDPFLMIYNSSSQKQTIKLETNTPFTLPTLTIRAESKKWETTRVIEFREDKSRYSDVLNFWVYSE